MASQHSRHRSVRADKGTGGKYLFTPPGWKGTVPKGYLHVPSLSYRLNMMLRSVKRGSATDVDAEAYSHRLRIYPLAQAGSPPPTRFVDGFPKAWDSLPHYDMRFYEYIEDLVIVEPVRARDKVMMGMLDSFGIAPGKKFEPTARYTEILEQSVVDARAFLEAFFEDWGCAMSKYYPDRQWGLPRYRPEAPPGIQLRDEHDVVLRRPRRWHVLRRDVFA
ncbi:DUF1254 domain-containing protein [Paraburkholderia sediminicola]|uniref:DUF1254 domain-containing protein n=1 Tax=Paraburkholderia sediminicola TaxID=458836 RepID=UPI0038BB099B